MLQYFWSDENPGACKTSQQPVGILRPDWLAEAEYQGQSMKDGHLCDVWTKAPWTPHRNFIYFYVDAESHQPVYWQFFDGVEQHVMAFEVGRTYVSGQDWAPAPQCLRENMPQLQDEAAEGVDILNVETWQPFNVAPGQIFWQ